MSEAAIIQAASEAGSKVHRSEGDFWTDGPINLSKFVRFLARQPYVVPDSTARIEALEAALRDISICRYPYAANIAQTALAPEQDK